jgi:hypothetical protein
MQKSSAYDLKRQFKEKQMGRPVNKRYFGVAGLENIKVRAKIGSNAEGDGYIVSQRSTRKFRVVVGANTGICTLVNKSTGALSANEMIINVVNDAGDTVQATKLYNRVAIVEGNQKIKWNFSSANDDGAVQVTDAKAVITIGTQPQDASVTAPDPATFTVVATVLPSRTLTYQWQIQQEGAGAWTNISGATSASYTTGATATGDGAGATDGDKFRVIVSAADADSVTSDAATLTVTE